MAVIDEISTERRRQIQVEGWTPEHDDQHGNGELGRAAAFYASHHAAFTYSDGPSYSLLVHIDNLWPWAPEWRKTGDARRNLVKAAALIVAEIERLDRASARAA